MAENPFLIDEKQNENTPPLPTTQVSEEQTQTPVLISSRSFGIRY